MSSVMDWLEEQAPQPGGAKPKSREEIEAERIARMEARRQNLIQFNYYRVVDGFASGSYRKSNNEEIAFKASNQNHLDRLLAKAHANAKDAKMRLIVSCGVMGASNEKEYDYR